MMDALQWAGFAGTLGGYIVLVRWSVLWGAVINFIGVSLLGVWAVLVPAWGLLALEISFAFVNLYVIACELRAKRGLRT